MPKTILVTGCAGFIGGNFVEKFKNKFPETTIVGIDDFSTGRRDAFDPREISFYEGSILDRELLKDIFIRRKPEYVFHFAALPRVSFSVENPHRTNNVNVGGTIALLEESKNHGVKRFIYSSSSSIYGKAESLPVRESYHQPNPLSPYALQKYIGEKYCKMFSSLFGLDTISLRYFNVFGPKQYGNSPYSTAISAWLESLYFPENKKGFLEGDGTQSRDFCFVDNVINANIGAMQSDRKFSGEEFNIAHNERTSLNDVIEKIESLTGKKLELEKRPPRVGDVPHTHADISKAKAHFGYEPQVKFDEGLKKTVEWFKTREI